MVLDEAETNFGCEVFNLDKNFLDFVVNQRLKVNA